MNIDVSPDGKTLLFDLLGDVYSMPSSGGQAKQLTRGIALNLRPVWLPDGRRFAYNSDMSGAFHFHVRDIIDEIDSMLGPCDYGQDMIWTPESSQLDKQLVRLSLDGKVAYYREFEKLFRYSYSTNTKEFVAAFPKGSFQGYLSPDAHWWAYVKDSNENRVLMLNDLLNGTERVLVSSLLQLPYSYKAHVPPCRFSFSPDSKSIYIGYGGKIHKLSVDGSENKIIPFVSNVKSDQGAFAYSSFRVTYDSVKIRYVRSTNRSSDGRHLIFSALNRLYRLELSSGKAAPIVDHPGNQFQPVFSKDGQWIAYVSWSDKEGGHLWRVPQSGGKPERLTRVAGHYERPAWSPDGRYIAVIRGDAKLNDRDDEGVGTLELVTLGGGQTREIDDSVPLWNHISFSPDGKQVIYQPKYKGSEDNSPGILLASKNIDGTNFRTLIVGPQDKYLQQRSLSPDGRFMVYSSREDMYLVPLVGTPAPQIVDAVSHPGIKFSQGVDPYWENGGKVLSWTYGNHFYSIDPNKIVDAVKTAHVSGNSTLSGDTFTASHIKPDKIIDLNIKMPAHYAHGAIALTNVRIISMRGDEVIEDGTIVIKDGRIASIMPSASAEIPREAKMLDLKGSTIIPGFVDLHLHMRLSPNIFPEQSWMFLANLAYGVTTARDPSLSFDSFGYTDLLNIGKMIGPRLYSVGRAARLGSGLVKCDNLDDARALVKKRLMMGGSVVKQYLLPLRMQRQWLLIACREAGLNMTNEGAFEPIYQFGMIKDGSTGIEHNPVWGDVYKDVIGLVVNSGIYFTPTLQVTNGAEYAKEYLKYRYWHTADDKMKRFIKSDPSNPFPTVNGAETLEAIINTKPKDTMELAFTAAARINAKMIRQGAMVALGSHGNDQGIGVHNELWALQMGGISNMEALRAATIIGAKGLGIQQDVGSLEPGKIADLIVLNKNPLDDIHNSRDIRYVMKDGILYDGNTLDKVWPE